MAQSNWFVIYSFRTSYNWDTRTGSMVVEPDGLVCDESDLKLLIEKIRKDLGVGPVFENILSLTKLDPYPKD